MEACVRPRPPPHAAHLRAPRHRAPHDATHAALATASLGSWLRRILIGLVAPSHSYRLRLRRISYDSWLQRFLKAQVIFY